MGRRERYRIEGPGGFGDAELVALILGAGVAGHSALQIAAGLLDRFGGLEGLLRRQPHELTAVVGIGLERAVRLHAALEAGRRALRTPQLPSEPVRTPTAAYQLLEPQLRGLVDEELHGLFLDRRRRPLARRLLTRGSDAFTVVDPRQVFRVAVGVGASSLILAHNHPSGDPEPSAQDHEVTHQVARAGRILGIQLVDHLVIGAGAFRSLAEAGVLSPWAPTSPSWTGDDPGMLSSCIGDTRGACGQPSSSRHRCR